MSWKWRLTPFSPDGSRFSDSNLAHTSGQSPLGRMHPRGLGFTLGVISKYRYPPAAVISLLSVTFAALPATIPGTKVRNG
jgi:hypothetical protein